MLKHRLQTVSKIVDELTEKICLLKSNIQDPYIIQAILWTLSPTKGLFAMNWLAGKDLAQTQADAMGLPPATEDDRESRALDLAGQVLNLIGDYQNIVICFDEVEPKAENFKGLFTPQVVALLAKDLYSQLKRGILMMTIFPVTWSHYVKNMPQAESVTDRIGEKILDLKYLNSDDVVALVSCWLQEFYQQKGLTPPNPLYPFDESELRQLGDEKPLTRDVLDWCRDNWSVPGAAPAPSDPLNEVKIAFEKQLAALDQEVDDYMEDRDLIADALHFGFYSIIGQTIGQVHVEDIEEVDVKSADKGYLDFRIVGQENNKQVKIVVSVTQSSSAKFVSATLKRLVDYKKFDMTRGCLVRSKSVKPGTHGHGFLDQLLSKQGGEWVLLKADDIKPLLAISLVFDACEEYGFTEEQVINFMQQNKIAEKNYLINEILSDPSGQIPDNAIDEDNLIAQEESMAKEFAAVVNGKSEANKASSIDELLMVIGS